MTTNETQRCHHTIFKWKQIAHILSCPENTNCFGIFENNKKHTKHLDNTDLPIWDKTAVFFPCCSLREGVIIALSRTHRQQHSLAVQTPGQPTQEKPACFVPGINGQCKRGHRILEHVFFILQKAHEGFLIVRIHGFTELCSALALRNSIPRELLLSHLSVCAHCVSLSGWVCGWLLLFSSH